MNDQDMTDETLEPEAETAPAEPDHDVEALKAELGNAVAQHKEIKEKVAAITADLKGTRVKVADIKAALKVESDEDERQAGTAALMTSEKLAAGLSAEQNIGRGEAKALEARIKELKATLKSLKVPTATRGPRAGREAQNGIVRPQPDSVSGGLWSIFDSTSATLGRPAGFAEAASDCATAGYKDATARSAYAHWRKFHGLTGRLAPAPAPSPEAAPEAEETAAAPEEAEDA